MAHEVESMMYVGDSPWHGLGVAIPAGKKLRIEEAIMASGLDWEIELRHVFTKDNEGSLHGILNQYVTCRTKDNAVLGIVGKDYRPLQNREAFKWFQPFLEAGEATLETAGSLKGGSRVWVLAKIRRDPLVVGKEDLMNHFVLLSNSHDGSLAVRVGFTPIRVVCNNTLCLAHESKASKLLRVKHTTRVREKLENIRETIDLAQREFAATVGQYRRLQAKEIDSRNLLKYVRIVFGLKERQRTPAQERQQKIIPSVVRLFENGKGSRTAGTNYWGAYNAVNEYLNYFRGKTQDNTLSSLWFGEGAHINKKALQVAMRLAG